MYLRHLPSGKHKKQKEDIVSKPRDKLKRSASAGIFVGFIVFIPYVYIVYVHTRICICMYFTLKVFVNHEETLRAFK